MTRSDADDVNTKGRAQPGPPFRVAPDPGASTRGLVRVTNIRGDGAGAFGALVPYAFDIEGWGAWRRGEADHAKTVVLR